MVSKKSPTTETKSVSEARKTFSETLNRVYRGETRVLVEKNGIPVGAIVSPQELGDIEMMCRRREELRTVLEETRAAFEGIPPEEIEREVEKAVAEVEEDHRRRRASESRKTA